MSDAEKNTVAASADEKEVVSRNFIEQLIDKDLAEGVYNTVHTLSLIHISEPTRRP